MSSRDDRLQSKSGYRREDRYRSRSRSRSRDRSRKHRRSRSTSRGRRSRSRSRSTDRYRRSRSRSSSRDRDRRKKSRRSRSRSRSRSMSPAPAQSNNSKGKQVVDTRSLMLKGLKLTTDEYMIHEIMSQFGSVVEVRLVKDKNTGEPRGFAFVDYATPQEAQSVIDQTRAVVTIDGVNATLDYAYAKPSAPPPPKLEPLDAKSDWVCPKCAGSNFARRAQCYYCQTPKPAFVQTTPSSASSLHPNDIPPSNVVIVKGLEPFTTEETLWHTFQLYGPIKEIRLIRDKITRASRCFCFVEFNTLEDAAKAVNSSDRLRIDEKFVKISYTVARGINPNLPEAIEQVKWAAAMQNYYDSTYGGGQAVSVPQPSDYETYKAINNGEIASRYVFDPKSRHYYDSQTGVYYDPEQNYFWDSFNNTYYMYDPVTKKYEKQKQQTAADANKEKKAEQKKANPTKSIATKKISKEFERWSKTGQELQKPAPKEKKAHHQYPPPNQVQPPPEPAPLVEAAPTYDDATLNAQFVNGLICMLCKRQLPSAEALQKHLDKSELHKNNLQAYKSQLTGNSTQETENTSETTGNP